MKNVVAAISLTVISFYGLATNAFSQDRRFDGGIHAGAGFTRVCCASADAVPEYNFQSAPAAGLSLSYNINEYLSFSTELNYTSIRSEREGLLPVPSGMIQGISADDGYFANYQNRLFLDYLEIPLLLRRSIGEKFKVYTVAGPFIGFLVAARVKTRGNGLMYEDKSGQVPAMIDCDHAYPEESFNWVRNKIDDLKPINLGGCGGIGVGYLYGKYKISSEVRYSVGLTNIWRNESINGSNKTDELSVRIGCTIPL